MAIWELRSAMAEAGWADVVVELDLAIQAIDSRELQAADQRIAGARQMAAGRAGGN